MRIWGSKPSCAHSLGTALNLQDDHNWGQGRDPPTTLQRRGGSHSPGTYPSARPGPYWAPEVPLGSSAPPHGRQGKGGLTRQLPVGPGGRFGGPHILVPRSRDALRHGRIPPDPGGHRGLFGHRGSRGFPQGFLGVGGDGFGGHLDPVPVRFGNAGDLLQVHHGHKQAVERESFGEEGVASK